MTNRRRPDAPPPICFMPHLASHVTRRGLAAACSLLATAAVVAPAHAQSSSATAEITAGSLTLVGSPSDVDFGSFALTGANGTLTGSQTFKVSDASGTAAGWKITAGGTQLTNGSGGTLPANAVTISSIPGVACDSGSSCTPADNGTWSPFTLPASPASAIMFRANAGTGMGIQDITPTWTLAVPGATAVGTYGATWTFTLTSGPS